MKVFGFGRAVVLLIQFGIFIPNLVTWEILKAPVRLRVLL